MPGKIILRFVNSYIKRSKNTYDDVFLEKKVFQSLAHLLPAAIIYYLLPWLFDGVAFDLSWLREGLSIYMIIVVITVHCAFRRLLSI
ncbi:MAG: hypothetical protein U5L96_15320 [Owenweeksia sp.]|nr:hypothetical protein [Owenweeksia sp.]